MPGNTLFLRFKTYNIPNFFIWEKMDRLFVVNKPIFISSNSYLSHIKRKYNTKKAGFSGTLDPFATGCLIVATGAYTKLFQYLNKSPKVYRATLWLGACSETLDIEHISSIERVPEFDLQQVTEALNSFKGNISYLPPKFSAKKINGQKAYKLAREGKEPALKEIKSEIYNIKLLHYTHPFIAFEIEVSEGAYIRSIAQLIAKKLGVTGTLSSLHRVSEGAFRYENEKALNPFEYLNIEQNRFLGDYKDLELGKKLAAALFEKQQDGVYFVESKNFYAILEIKEGLVKYRLNRIPKPQSHPQV